MTSNDNRRPMSEFGQELFDMMVQANEVWIADSIVQKLRKPVITQQIKRISTQVKP